METCLLEQPQSVNGRQLPGGGYILGGRFTSEELTQLFADSTYAALFSV